MVRGFAAGALLCFEMSVPLLCSRKREQHDSINNWAALKGVTAVIPVCLYTKGSNI